jgi:uncharacterized damage-inducible protein DinB
MRKLLLLTILTMPIFSAINSQTINLDDVKAQMVKDWERAKAYTVDYLNTMPADKYSFRAVDSIRSFANQMLHLAGGNAFLMSTALGTKPPAWLSQTLELSPTAQDKDSVMYYVTASYDYCIDAVKNSDTKKWHEKTKFFRFEETRFAMLNKTFEHQGHHRGQTTIYIRLQGIKPPEERLF